MCKLVFVGLSFRYKFFSSFLFCFFFGTKEQERERARNENEFNVVFIFRRFHDKYQFMFDTNVLIMQHFIIKQASRHRRSIPVIRNAFYI